MKNWSNYHAMVGETPNPLTEATLEYLSGDKKCAFDLGAGNMRDCKYLLSQGFERVKAVDEHPICSQYCVPGIEFEMATLPECYLADGGYDFGISCNTMFFLSQQEMFKVLEKVHKALRVGGVFGCNLAGTKSDWYKQDKVHTYLTATDVKLIRKLYKPLEFESQEWDAPDSANIMRHWHFWNLIFRKQ